MLFKLFIKLLIGIAIGGIVISIFGMMCSIFDSIDVFKSFKILFFISMGLFLLGSLFYVGG